MKQKQQRTVLYGNSLIMAGVRADLSACPGIELIILDHPLAQPAEQICALRPDALIFDLGAIQPDFPFCLLQLPDLLLIGLDPETHQALVWSGRRMRAFSAQDLVQAIEAGMDLPKEGNLKELSNHSSNYRTT
jgi:hypothetical protein